MLSSSSPHPSTMLTANDAIHGWSPAGDNDMEVNVSQDMYFMAINPITPSSSLLSPVCPPLNTPSKTCHPQSKPISVAPLAGTARHTIAPSSDRRAQRNRNRDPSWIPRPRNAFIIFRCEYSREHAQSTQGSQSEQDSAIAVKTLSKRAAEAWKQLSASERERYKVLAEREREEHARLYPHYRFRPMKRQASGTGSRSCERSRSPKEVSVERHPAPSVRLPSVLSAAPEKPCSNALVERSQVSEPNPLATSLSLPEPLSYPIDQSQTDPEVLLGMDYTDAISFYSSPETILPSDSSPPSAVADLYPALHLHSQATGMPPDTFHCNDPAFGLGLHYEDLERAQDLEAYAIGLYEHDLFSPFPFPEYY